jgi:hypothetical protein
VQQHQIATPALDLDIQPWRSHTDLLLLDNSPRAISGALAPVESD